MRTIRTSGLPRRARFFRRRSGTSALRAELAPAPNPSKTPKTRFDPKLRFAHTRLKNAPHANLRASLESTLSAPPKYGGLLAATPFLGTAMAVQKRAAWNPYPSSVIIPHEHQLGNGHFRSRPKRFFKHRPNGDKRLPFEIYSTIQPGQGGFPGSLTRERGGAGPRAGPGPG